MDSKETKQKMNVITVTTHRCGHRVPALSSELRDGFEIPFDLRHRMEGSNCSDCDLDWEDQEKQSARIEPAFLEATNCALQAGWDEFWEPLSSEEITVALYKRAFITRVAMLKEIDELLTTARGLEVSKSTKFASLFIQLFEWLRGMMISRGSPVLWGVLGLGVDAPGRVARWRVLWSYCGGRSLPVLWTTLAIWEKRNIQPDIQLLSEQLQLAIPEVAEALQQRSLSPSGTGLL